MKGGLEPAAKAGEQTSRKGVSGSMARTRMITYILDAPKFVDQRKTFMKRLEGEVRPPAQETERASE